MNKMLCVSVGGSGFLALFMVFLSGPSYRLEVLDLGGAFTLLRWGAYLGIASIPMIIGYAFWRKPPARINTLLSLSALAALIAVSLPLSQLQTARSVPPIHDISTDLTNPPEFVDILPLRQDSPNPAAYAGEETARQQREAYPDITPLESNQPLEIVFQAAQDTIRALGWELVAAQLEDDNARLEATDTTFWFGFKDDVIIRISTIGEETIVDLRSKSRVGRSDLGVNARRIQYFLTALQIRLAEES